MSRFNLFAVSSLGETRKSAARNLRVFFFKKNSAPEKQQIVRALTVVLTLFQNSAHTLAVPVSASTRVYRSFRFHLHNSVFIFTFVYLRRIKRRGADNFFPLCLIGMSIKGCMGWKSSKLSAQISFGLLAFCSAVQKVFGGGG